MTNSTGATDAATFLSRYGEETPSLEGAFPPHGGERWVLASGWAASGPYTMVLREHFCHHLPEGQDEGSTLRKVKLDRIKEFGTDAVPLC